jgi:ABC-type phosphate/phosphonate transport system substrate-binding protein
MLPRTYTVCAPAALPTLFAVGLLVVLLALLPGSIAGEELRPAPLQIGLSGSLMRGVPDSLVSTTSRPMLAMIETRTRLKAEFAVVPDADRLAERLVGGNTSLGVFQGCEFAWVRAKHTKLIPLVVAVNQKPYLSAVVLVGCDSPATKFADLHERQVAMPGGSQTHCRLFCERNCRSCGEGPDKFFARITTPVSAEEALDEVADGTLDGAIVDGVALECYQRRKPGRATQLKELVRSEAFPATVIAYQSGTLDEASLRRFREALIDVKQTAAGRQVLALWRMTGFEAVPKDYDETLARIARAYPSPGKGK